MQRVPVPSSNVASVGYDASTQTLEVEFRNGALYQYFDVPEQIFQELMNAASLGSYLNAVIKQGFRYARL